MDNPVKEIVMSSPALKHLSENYPPRVALVNNFKTKHNEHLRFN